MAVTVHYHALHGNPPLNASLIGLAESTLKSITNSHRNQAHETAKKVLCKTCRNEDICSHSPVPASCWTYRNTMKNMLAEMVESIIRMN